MPYCCLISVILLFSLSTKSQDMVTRYINYETSLMNYIENPGKQDSSCIKAIKKAESDIAAGKEVFCLPIGLNYIRLRCEEALKMLLEGEKMMLMYDTIEEQLIETQTSGCYCARIRKHQYATKGADFRKKLILKADSIFAEHIFRNNSIIDSWLCDEPPSNGKDEMVTTLYYPSGADSCERDDLIQLSFVIGLDGSISDLSVSRQETAIDPVCEQKLLLYAQQQLQQQEWQAGKIKGKLVRTRMHFRINTKK